VKQLTDEALRISALDDEAIGENEFFASVKAKCEELRDQMVEKIETDRGDPPEDTEWPEIDRSSLPIRVPDDILYTLLR
jgi:hypothetical protein